VTEQANHHLGLSAEARRQRLARFGPNTLPAAARRPAWKRLLAQFNNLLIHVLMVAGVAAALLGHAIDAVVILAVVAINAVIGFVQEGKAEQAMAAIGKMLAADARVLEDGRWQTRPAESLVPDDVVQIQAGDQVPADLRLIEAHGLRTDQAALTGESVPVGKSTDPDADDTDLADRRNSAYSGTLVTAGQGAGVVFGTGERTEIGRISTLLSEVEVLTTPLLQRINQFARLLTALIITLAITVVGLGAWLHALAISDGLLAGIALAVAAIPEGLPAIITITLAIGVQAMAQRKAVIRRLPAVETLGSVSVICSDKTGTLTANHLTARVIALPDRTHAAADLELTGAAEALMLAGVLCNNAEGDPKSGDPLELALLELAQSHGLSVAELRQNHPRLSLIPFASDHKYMATLHPGVIMLKGAPEVVLELCSIRDGAGYDAGYHKRDWRAELERLTGQGLRVLALASRAVDDNTTTLDEDQSLSGFKMLGLVGFADPPRPEVPDAIAQCQSAGMQVKMITGDHASTALAIARELGITPCESAQGTDQVLTGRDIDQLDDAALAARVRHVHVYARTTPEHKLRLVTALQAHGEVVAMTGDGANDAPALKRADIGVAMGIKGTEAARQAADMVLVDDNFATIVNGIQQGRGVYDNIRKAILFILPTNAAQALVVIAAVLAGVTLPITPVQILWVNMAISVTLALALAFEPTEPGIMKRPPRPLDQGLLTSFVVTRVVWVGALLTVGTFVMFNQVLASTGDEALARTVAVNLLVAGQITYLFSCRRWQAASFTLTALLANRWAWMMVAALLIMQGGFTYWPPMQTIFGTHALPADYWPPMLAFAAMVFILVELEKALTRQLGLRWAQAS